MFITWSTNATDIVNIIVSAKNAETGVEICTTAKWNETEVSFKVDDEPANYYVTVSVFDSCQNNYVSMPYPVFMELPSFKVEKTSISDKYLYNTQTAKHIPSCSQVNPPPTQQCPQSDGGIFLLLCISTGSIIMGTKTIAMLSLSNATYARVISEMKGGESAKNVNKKLFICC